MSGPQIDPGQATALELNRAAFVGITAAATVAPLASARPPVVPEDDPAIKIERVELRRPDVVEPSYAAWPVNAGEKVPSVVVIQHAWGVDASIRDIVRRLAKAGFAAIAPDLYGRSKAPSGDGVTDIEVFRPFMKQLDRKQYDGDIRAAALWLQTKFPSTKTGVLGFCMGGHIALIQAIDNADIFAVACPFYGAIKDIDPEKIAIPICGSYGARDTGIEAEDVKTWRTELRVPNDIRIYTTAGHAFMDDNRPSYVAVAADDAWKRTVAFLKQYLVTK